MSLEDSVDDKKIFCCFVESWEKMETKEYVDPDGVLSMISGWRIQIEIHEMQIQIYTPGVFAFCSIFSDSKRHHHFGSVHFVRTIKSIQERKTTNNSLSAFRWWRTKKEIVRFIDRGGFHWHRFICGDISLVFLSSLAHFSYRTMHTMSSLFHFFLLLLCFLCVCVCCALCLSSDVEYSSH